MATEIKWRKEKGKSFWQSDVCQTPQQIPGQRGRDLFPRLVAWQQGAGTICPQADEPVTLVYMKPPFLISQAFLQSCCGCCVYKAELGYDF